MITCRVCGKSIDMTSGRCPCGKGRMEVWHDPGVPPAQNWMESVEPRCPGCEEKERRIAELEGLLEVTRMALENYKAEAEGLRETRTST